MSLEELGASPRAMNAALVKLVPAIASYVLDHGGYLTKTKLLKLLYLFDVEYCRIHRQTYTGFEWKFLHLGPWAREFDEVLKALVAQGVLAEVESAKPDFEAKFYRTCEPIGIDGLFQSFRDEAILKGVLDKWGGKTTGEILDYVYFYTEPMEHGVRNAPLDFSRIEEQRRAPYVRSSSADTPRELGQARWNFRKRMQALALEVVPDPACYRVPAGSCKSGPPAKLSRRISGEFRFTLPRYDEKYFEAIAKLDAAR